MLTTLPEGAGEHILDACPLFREAFEERRSGSLTEEAEGSGRIRLKAIGSWVACVELGRLGAGWPSGLFGVSVSPLGSARYLIKNIP